MRSHTKKTRAEMPQASEFMTSLSATHGDHQIDFYKFCWITMMRLYVLGEGDVMGPLWLPEVPHIDP